MQRRIDQANRHWEAVHRLENSDEVATLERQQFIEGRHARFLGIRQDHFLNGALPLMTSLGLLEVGKKHMLRAAQTTALRAELTCLARILRSICIGAYAKFAR